MRIATATLITLESPASRSGRILVAEALRLAERAHRGRRAKGSSDGPFLLHPLSVALLLASCGAPADVISAGLLHDVVEKESVRLADVATACGSRVAALVAALTEIVYDPTTSEPASWHARKRDMLARLRTSEPDALAIKAADLSRNAADLARQQRESGDVAWCRFEVDASQQLAWYGALAAVLRPRLGGYERLRDEVGFALAELEWIPLPAESVPWSPLYRFEATPLRPRVPGVTAATRNAEAGARRQPVLVVERSIKRDVGAGEIGKPKRSTQSSGGSSRRIHDRDIDAQSQTDGVHATRRPPWRGALISACRRESVVSPANARREGI